MTNIFLAIVGGIYVILAGWCAIQPQNTAESIGFTLQKGSGQSEYLTVYGGFQLALGLLLLWPLIRPEASYWMLVTCLVMHGGLVLFRTVSFTLYSGISATTYTLASIEWVVFLSAALLLWLARDAGANS